MMSEIDGHISYELTQRIAAEENRRFVLGPDPEPVREPVQLTVHQCPSLVTTALKIRTAERFIPPERWDQYQRRLRLVGLTD